MRPRRDIHQYEPVGATGTLKLFIENPEFIGPPGNYGMDKIGWPDCEASIENNFRASNEYHPIRRASIRSDIEAMPNSTVVRFEIINCGTNGTCGGSAAIEFERSSRHRHRSESAAASAANHERRLFG